MPRSTERKCSVAPSRTERSAGAAPARALLPAAVGDRARPQQSREVRAGGGRRADGDRDKRRSGRLGLAADAGGIGGTGMVGAGRGKAPGVGAVTGSARPAGASWEGRAGRPRVVWGRLLAPRFPRLSLGLG